MNRRKLSPLSWNKIIYTDSNGAALREVSVKTIHHGNGCYTITPKKCLK